MSRGLLLGWVFSMLLQKWGCSSGWMAQWGWTSTALLQPVCHPGCLGLCWAHRGVQGGTHTRGVGENAARWDPSLACIPHPAPTIPMETWVMTTIRSPPSFPCRGTLALLTVTSLEKVSKMKMREMRKEKISWV